MPRRERWEVEMAARVADLREGAGLTQQELAERAGVSVWTLRRWEQKGNTPLVRVLVRVAKALGVSLDVLAGLAEPPAAKKKGGGAK
jgi:transcriptional regulator with XRE-family HTH domain